MDRKCISCNSSMSKQSRRIFYAVATAVVVYILLRLYRKENFSFGNLFNTAKNDLKNDYNLAKNYISGNSQKSILGGTDHPVIMIPGLGGSILEATWDFSFSFEYIECQEKSTTYQQIWPTVYSAIPIENECWYRLMKTTVNPQGDIVSNAYVRPRQGLAGIAVLDSIEVGFLDIPLYNYFETMVLQLQSLNYKFLYGYPYDFRTITNEVAILNFVNGMKSLVMKAYNVSGGKKVNLISHSLGCICTTYFLNSMTLGWKTKYINIFVPIAPPFLGSSGALEALLTGNTENIPITDRFIRGLEKNMGAIIWMINNSKWTGGEVIPGGIQNALIQSGNNNAEKLVSGRLEDMWITVYKDPGVPVHVFHGSNNQTILKLEYKDGYNNQPDITYENLGDGTVNGISLTAAVDVFKWKNTVQTELSGDSHMGILSDPRLFSYF